MEAIELKEVSAGYNGTPILSNISLKVEAGEFLGIIGPNGVGKSTLLRIMSGTLATSKGEVQINGKNIREYKRKELAKIEGVVPQQSFFSLPFKCFDVVLMGRFPYVGWREKHEDYEIATRAMKLTETYELKDRLIQEVSGGELQRVRIARALSQEPKILLMDEPTAHLDIYHEIRIFEILKKLNVEGLTVIITSHDLNTVGAYAKTLALLSNGSPRPSPQSGQIVKLGTPDEVLEKNLIEEVYHARVIIKEHPATHTPFVIPIASEE